MTALVALFGFFLLPDDPSETRWLTPEERELCIKRISRDTVGQQTRGKLGKVSSKPARILEPGFSVLCRTSTLGTLPPDASFTGQPC